MRERGREGGREGGREIRCDSVFVCVVCVFCLFIFVVLCVCVPLSIGWEAISALPASEVVYGVLSAWNHD